MEQNSNTVKGEAPLACTDLLMLIAVSVMYGIGKDETCGINADGLVLAYIILKSCFIFLRIILCCGVIFLKKAGLIIYLAWIFIWVIGIIVFYIIVLVNFFDSDNNCKGPATNIWVALLLVTIEAIAALSILAILLCCLSFLVPIIICLSVAKKN
ncbi:unnamed protein product [Moneuplotes crassus]|uniref:Transmembrane protein n=1 Tax=Euplotes crassus TaxID=5936 RepID=A0AAD1Y1Q8_EUPCR|nr:unnamed protein product [Moneuplotes crassus]